MLKISTQQSQEKMIVRIEGRLVTPWTTELEAAWTDIAKTKEREHILQVLRATGGVIAGPRGAAAKLGLIRTTLNSRLRKLGIQRHEYIS